MVVGSYDFGRRGPWLELPVDPSASVVTEAELERDLDSLLWNSPSAPAPESLLLSLEAAIPRN